MDDMTAHVQAIIDQRGMDARKHSATPKTELTGMFISACTGGDDDAGRTAALERDLGSLMRADYIGTYLKATGVYAGQREESFLVVLPASSANTAMLMDLARHYLQESILLFKSVGSSAFLGFCDSRANCWQGVGTLQHVSVNDLREGEPHSRLHGVPGAFVTR